MTTYYDLLDIDDEASKAEVRKAYLKLAATCHPDKSPEDPDATVKFQLISEAYTTLYDDDARRRYDQKLNEPMEIATSRPCHVPVYHPPPAPPTMPTMPSTPVGIAPIPPFHMYPQAPPWRCMTQIHVQHFMHSAYIPNRQAIHRNHILVASPPIAPSLHWRPSPPMQRPPPPVMRLLAPQSHSIPPELIRFRMLMAAEARRRSSQLGLN